MRRKVAFAKLIAAALLVAGIGPLAAEAPLSFRTAGGDAWTFEKQIAGAARSDACDAVAITSPSHAIMVPVQDGQFFTHLRLEPGSNELRAQCLRDGAPQGDAAVQHWQVHLSDRPKAWISVSLDDDTIVLDALPSELAPSRAAPIVAYEWRAHDGNPAPLPDLPALGARIELTIPDVDGEYYATLRVSDALGRADESTIRFRVRHGRAEIVDPQQDAPAWVDHAVIYGVEPPLFGPRGLDDVTARLDELVELGVTVLWLLPITASPPGDFGYAVVDYFRVRPEFGTADDLRELVEAAHARGLRVMMDFVPNHLSDQHAYFADTASREHRSPYFEFFARTAEGDVAHYFGWENLKNLNYDHPEVQQLVIEAFSYWVHEFDIDGFRVDVAWGPRQRAPEFWPRWRAELKRIKPDLLLLAEASARDPYYGEHGFDAAYDWTEKLGEWAWRDAFDNEAETANRLREQIAASAATNVRVVRFLNNNDTGPRFVTRYGVARTRVAAAMLLTLPGLPALYSGDAVGHPFEPYGEKTPIVWEDRLGLRAWYERLIDLRRAEPALSTGSFHLLDLGAPDQVLAYIRPGPDAESSLLILLNFGSSSAQPRLTAEAMRLSTHTGQFLDVLNDERINVDVGSRQITLSGQSARILRPVPASSAQQPK